MKSLATEIYGGICIGIIWIGSAITVREKAQEIWTNAYHQGAESAYVESTTATDNTAVEQPEAEVNLPAGERNPPAASMSEPEEAEEQDVPPPVAYNLPAVFTDYTTAALEATSSRELLVVLHPGYSLEKLADLQRRMGETKAAHRYVWLILDATAMVKQQKAQDYFGAERPSAVVIHNPVTGENRQVTKLADLE